MLLHCAHEVMRFRPGISISIPLDANVVPLMFDYWGPDGGDDSVGDDIIDGDDAGDGATDGDDADDADDGVNDDCPADDADDDSGCTA